jgi:hypothetical protein
MEESFRVWLRHMYHSNRTEVKLEALLQKRRCATYKWFCIPLSRICIQQHVQLCNFKCFTSVSVHFQIQKLILSLSNQHISLLQE